MAKQTEFEILTGKAEAYLKAWLPYVAKKVCRALPKGTANEDGLQAGVICHISDHAAFFRGPKASRPWVRVLPPSQWNTERRQSTVMVSIAVATALDCVRALLEGVLESVLKSDEGKKLSSKRSELLTKVGILQSGKLDSETRSEVAELVKVAGEYPVPNLQKVSRTRPKQGNRTAVYFACPKACSKQADRTKGLTAIGVSLSRFQSEWVTITCKACGSELIKVTSKAEADKKAKARIVTETAELPTEA